MLSAACPSAEVLSHFGVGVVRELGGRVNRHWLVDLGGGPAVLRQYTAPPFGVVAFELRVLEALEVRGWPVPAPLAAPADLDGRTWCLFRWLEGTPSPAEDDAGRRARGRLLALLHEDLEDPNALGQRQGCRMAHEVVDDPDLHKQLACYERLVPEEGRMMRWHAERARELFAAVDLSGARRVVLHSDFTPWNLLYTDGRLAGVLDFEATHLNYAVADFALAWRGKYDALIAGYEDVRPLDDLEWSILTPVFWSWMFLGVADAIRDMVAGAMGPVGFDWTVDKLLVRSPLMGGEAVPFRVGP